MGLTRRRFLIGGGLTAGFGLMAGGWAIANRDGAKDSPLEPSPGDLSLRNRDDSHRLLTVTGTWYGTEGDAGGQMVYRREFPLGPGTDKLVEDAFDQPGRYEVIAETAAGMKDGTNCLLLWTDDGSEMKGRGAIFEIFDEGHEIARRTMRDGEVVLTGFSRDPPNPELQRTCSPT